MSEPINEEKVEQVEKVEEKEPRITKEEMDKEKEKLEKTREDMRNYLNDEFGITPEQVQGWKDKYKSIYVLFFEDEPYIVRGISRQEWRLINAKTINTRNEELALEEQIAKNTILYPETELNPTDPACAGLASTIYQTVLRLSKFEPDLPPIRL